MITKKLMTLQMAVLLTTSMMTSRPLFAKTGTETGGGGDTVVCNGKTRVLDSVIMENANGLEIKRAENSQAKLNEIKNKLLATLPSMGSNLETFIAAFNKKSDVQAQIYWVNGVPKDIKDENLFIEIPKECSNLTQAIIRANGATKRFYYNAEVLNKLSQNKDELSWMLVHEWLRNYANDSDIIRSLNGYLHSSTFLTQDEGEVHDAIINADVDRNIIGDTKTISQLRDKQIESKVKKLDSLISKFDSAVKEYYASEPTPGTSSWFGRWDQYEYLRRLYTEIFDIQSSLEYGPDGSNLSPASDKLAKKAINKAKSYTYQMSFSKAYPPTKAEYEENN